MESQLAQYWMETNLYNIGWKANLHNIGCESSLHNIGLTKQAYFHILIGEEDRNFLKSI